ncbi:MULTISPECIES: type VI secretion system baseplate subunit TssE [Acinetobacter]|uniref:Type VI secretion system baseplate subunit TssE n=1 Tax=Acinetobacter piscicola TaxID=2006115 RepID=A0A7S7AIG2_9GAMM|nr:MULTISPECIES: type VI secretion system baseplate subunit TssE [Acinetobacter]QOW47016.1 type VI secretion system baseplate subunit TssE [Acinetobacter piscicola]
MIKNRSDKNIASLFDRLTEEHHLDGVKGLDNQKMKQMVIRDLLFLLNTPSYYYSKEDEQIFEYESSVLNFGIEPISGKRVSEIDWGHVERNIQKAIGLFEPRILKSNLEVKCIFGLENKAKYNLMNIEIKGYIKSTPFPERFVLKTHLDVETGNFDLIN